MSQVTHHDRKLAAILFADIVGYTALMQEGEGNAMSILSRFEDVTARAVGKHGGEIIKNYGDGSLILFDNTVNAVRCACMMQWEFQKEQIVPLRIGIHVGEVVHKGSDVFGDSVNLTARIESIGMPGAVLLSTSAHNKIRNQEEFLTRSLGFFTFKNVTAAHEIFAISNEGMVVPSKEDLSNKLKAQLILKWYQKPVIRAIAGLGILLLIVGLININQLFSSNATTISEENKEKRIAVLNFTNLTPNSDLDTYGNMLADWITRGLIETEDANVVNSANLQHLFGEINSVEDINAEFVDKSGIDLLLQGRYYIAEDQMIVIADITDIASGEVIRSFKVEGDEGVSMKLLDDLSNEIMSYWAVKDNIQLSQNPPNFEAYKEYLKGISLYTVNAKDALIHMDKAFTNDTSFYLPLFKAWALYTNLAEIKDAIKIQDYLAERKHLFSTFEKLTFESIVAAQEHRFFDAAQSNYQKYKMDPSDIRANFGTANMYNSGNYPRRTIETIDEFDERLSSENEGIISWRLTLKAFAYYRLKEYGAVHQLIDESSFARMPHALADFHMLSLIRMDSIPLIAAYYQKYSDEGVYGFTGMKITNDQLLVNICSELIITQKKDLLQEYAQKLKDWETGNEVNDMSHDRPDIFNNRPFRQVESRGYAHFFLGEMEDAIQAWSEENIPASNWPDIIERASRLGYCYATIGDVDNAELQLQTIDHIELSHPELLIQKSYYKSRILAAMGQNDKAIEELSNSIRSGISFFRIFSFDRDPFLLPLINLPLFDTLVRPKE